MGTIEEKKEEVLKEMRDARSEWKGILDNLGRKVREDIKDIIDVQTEAISYRQTIIEDINIYAVKIYRLVQKMKVKTKEKFEFYATSYQVKTSGTEKLRLIEADLSEYQEFINELDEHVIFLRETSKNLDQINYAVKNKIELANILGGYR